MGHHIDAEGRFQSDKHPELPPDKIILSFQDRASREGLWHFALHTEDRELGADIKQRLESVDPEGEW